MDTRLDTGIRHQVLADIASITACDEREARDRQHALDWITNDPGIYRTTKPDVPPKHLVAYFVVADPADGKMLLVAHRGAGLLLPTGGHASPGETLWQTVQRECSEELAITATPTPTFGRGPLFISVTATRDPHGAGGSHTDVTAWHIIHAHPGDIRPDGHDEFSGIRWLTPPQILHTPVTELDPQMHRFIGKYLDRLHRHG